MLQRAIVVSGLFNTVRRLGCAAGIAAALCASSAPALAQPGGGGGGPGGGGFMGGGGMFGGRGGFEPAFNSEQLKEYGQLLELDEGQQAAVDDRYQAYLAEYQEIAGKMRDAAEGAREEFRETRDPAIWEDISRMTEEFQKRSAEIEGLFVEDFKIMLTEQQLERWPRVERQRRRDASMGRGLLSGEQVDLVRVTRRMELSETSRAAIAAPLEEYEKDLDTALAERNTLFDEGMRNARELFRNFEENRDQMEEMFQKARDASVRVREVNRRYASDIAAALAESERPVFEARVKEASHPRIYGRTSVDRTFEEATADGIGLTADQRAQIDAVMGAFKADLAAANDRLARTVEESEKDMTIESMFRGGRGGGGSPEAEEARRARRDLERKAEEAIREVLTEEQKAKLPQRPERGDWRRNGFGGEDGGDGERRGGDRDGRGGGRGGDGGGAEV